MIEFAFAIVLSLIIPFMGYFYFGKRKDAISDNDCGQNVEQKLLKRDLIVLVSSGVSMIGTFLIGKYYFCHESVFWIYRWQIAVGLMIPIAVVDFKEQIIPNKLLLIGICVLLPVIVVQVFISNDYIFSILSNSIIGFLFGGGIFLLSSLVVRGGIGAGDVKLFAFLGFLLYFRGVFNVLLYSMVFSAIFAIVLLILKKKKKNDVLPLAPFTLFGVVLSILLGV